MIRNVVFDVGNVFVRWSPHEVVERCFNLPVGSQENALRAQTLFKSPLWFSLNRGELSSAEAESAYSRSFGMTADECRSLFFHVTDHMVAIEGTEKLARRLKTAGYGVYGLTDNVREIVAYIQKRHTFWSLFDGVIVSADVGLLKPDQRIFRRVIDSYNLKPHETVFVDDFVANVAGAQAAGWAGCIFADALSCERNLRDLGLIF